MRPVGGREEWRGEALRDSEHKYRSIFENSMDAIILAVPGRQLTAANPAACAMFGMTEEELCRVGRKGIEDPADTRHDAAVEERSERGRVKYEGTHVRSDGSRFPTEVSSVIMDGGSRSLVIIRDLTERKRAEAALRESEQSHRLLVQHLHAGVVIHAPDTQILFANERASFLLGLSDDQMMGKTAVDPALVLRSRGRDANASGGVSRCTRGRHTVAGPGPPARYQSPGNERPRLGAGECLPRLRRR
jgi:PAS domain S-box-containing protein